MSHFSPGEFVDFAEGTLDASRASHLSACDACRAQASSVRDALRMTGAPDLVPEPSPLFWEHLSARIRDGVASERPAFAFGFGGLRLHPMAATLTTMALAVAIFSAALLTRHSRETGAPEPIAAATSPVVSAVPETDVAFDAPDNDVWTVLTAAAADMQLDDARAAGIAVQPATVDRAVQRLSAAELAELGRLLQSELRRSSN